MIHNRSILILSLLVWGGLSRNWLEMALLLLLISISFFSPWRWQITLKQFYRWGDLCTLLLILQLLYVYIWQTSHQPIFMVLKWMPLLFAPALLTQLFSTQQNLPLGTLFYSYRRKNEQQARIDFQLPFAALCILSAGAANVRGVIYLYLAEMIFGIILFYCRPKQQRLWLWSLMLGLAMLLTYYGQYGLARLHGIIEQQSVAWLSEWKADPFKSQTSIGDIGNLKLSDKIVFRIRAAEPLLLLQASYNIYLGQSWVVSDTLFREQNPNQNPSHLPLKQMQVWQALHQEEILALPDGTVEIKGLEGADLSYNGLGAVKLSNAPEFAQYQVFYTGQRTETPTNSDVRLPQQHLDWVTSVAQELKLNQLTPQQVPDKITEYFHRNFFYSLYLGEEEDSVTALRDFMLKRKAGHCEYFAVATVLLLRQAGIPARLANGYAVDEYDSEQDLYIVRRRHAHAWALAYIDKHWQSVDSTPSQWLEMEAENAAWWQPVADLYSNWLMVFDQWRIEQAKQQDNTLWLSVALLLSFYIAWRIYSAKRQLHRHKIKNASVLPVSYPGSDSEFYLLERYFQNTAQARQAHESLAQWLKRLELFELQPLYRLHYKLRFDPDGIAQAERELLATKLQQWLINHAQQASH